MKPTTTLRKIAQLKKRIRVIQGGQGAGKTFAILLILINHANGNPNKEIFVVSAELTKMRITVIKDFINIMKMLSIYSEDRMLGGTMYRFPNGSFIKFLGLDKADLGKGLRSDVVFLNEANKVDFETYRELTSRAKQIYIDFNPNARFWVHNEVVNRLDADFIKLTYKDNEFLSREEVNEIEGYKAKGYDSEGNEINAYWANKWRVYGLGEEGKIDGVIFQNWNIGNFDESLPVMYGIDWGFKDPFVLIKVAFNGKARKLYIQEQIYKSMLSPKEIIELLKAKIPDRNALIIADSADTTQIVGVKNEGFNIMPATKEKIIIGIRHLQDWEIVISPDSSNVINEFHNYIWLDKSGEVPIDGFNHCFVGNTKITTLEGEKEIKEVKEGDKVLTTNGYKKVLKTFDNGIKSIFKYSIQFDTFSVILEATDSHKIKTDQGWIQLKELKEGMTVYHSNAYNEKTNIQSVKIVSVHVERKSNERVYDLMIDENHEYFANGLLVHNCIDPLRYCEKFYRYKNS